MDRSDCWGLEAWIRHWLQGGTIGVVRCLGAPKGSGFAVADLELWVLSPIRAVVT